MGNEATGFLVGIATRNRLDHIEVVLHIIEGAILRQPVEERANLVSGRHESPAVQAMLSEYGLAGRNSTLGSNAVGSAA